MAGVGRSRTVTVCLWVQHGTLITMAFTPTNEPCVIGGCEKLVYNRGRGLCKAHYGKFLKHGDPNVTLRPDLGFTFEERFWRKVNKDGPTPEFKPELGPCWLWTAGLSRGYGQFIVMRGSRGYPVKAHRIAYGLLAGEIPDGSILDHVCHNGDKCCPGGDSCLHRACVNPGHLEPVTNEENILRGNWGPVVNARKTHCIHGHEFTEENTYRPKRGGRQCYACLLRRGGERAERLRAKRAEAR